ncbi:DUF2057 family protein [Vibrio spartinae]|uniref:UPF0319 protein VSP9026_02457 n=1 Tax=Vibrio spartinae TaxID=1918945 RepID=A0A1N6M5U2_9VIBR|nr:DUF2057 family protein [Vibrio spartinae]QMV14929.1 hypothetical protein Vspart_02205 [Vibrio spartinae]SIO94727.1 hypothetical protein VSP9026_02457 [Vibrio spartinae]
MKIALPLLFTLSLGIVPCTAAAKTVLQIPDNVEVFAINAQPPEKASGLFPSNKEELDNGINQIVFKYSPEFEISKDIQHAYSQVIIAKFKASDTQLHFKLPSYRSLTQARQKIDHMQWALVDAQGNNVVIAEDTLQKNGLQVGRDYVQEAQHYNAGSGIAAIHVSAVSDIQDTAATSPQPAPSAKHNAPATQITPSKQLTSASSPNLSQLKHWYQKSTEQERKAFRKWIIDQE